MTNVWKELDHEHIFKAVESALGTRLSNLCRRRNSYINRVYEFEEEDGQKKFIVKFYRPGRWTKEMILEEHQFLKDLHHQEIPVIPPLEFKNKTLFSFGAIPFALFPKKGGRVLDEFKPEGWEELGRLLARVHLLGATHKKTKRITWKPSIATKHHLEVLEKTNYILPDFKEKFHQVAEAFIKAADPVFAGQELILLHGDCHKGNLIHRPNEGIYIIDFDDICFGPPVQDIWMLLPGSVDDCEKELGWFLKGYETFREFERGSLDLVPALRGMRIIHFISWLAVQSHDPDFSKHFPLVGTRKYWNEIIKDLQEIIYNGII